MLEINNITVRFGGVTAVDNISFKLRKGEMLGLIGPNGAGKTTLMRTITGAVKPDKGSIKLEDKVITQQPTHIRIREGIGLSQQIVHPFKSMTILENVVFAAGYNKTKHPVSSIFKFSRSKEKTRAMEILHDLEIDHVANDLPGNLPLGFLKRLELARALALNPGILLLDEPLAGLNQKEAKHLADKLIELNKAGQTILIIEHNLGEVIRICDRLFVIDNGKEIGQGEPMDVMNDPVVRTAYIGKGKHAVS